jgi:hypothetical protein
MLDVESASNVRDVANVESALNGGNALSAAAYKESQDERGGASSATRIRCSVWGEAARR